jgi:hypothetical protein
MKMNDFEDRLRALPICKPSHELRERIFGKKTARLGLKSIIYGRVPVAWAAAASVIMGLVGFFIASLWVIPTQPKGPIREASMNVQIIYQAPKTPHVFDFTERAVDFLPGDVNVQVKSHGEV